MDDISDRIYDATALPCLSGKVYAITGTTSGTGLHAARAALRRGARTIILLNRPSPRAAAAVVSLRATRASDNNNNDSTNTEIVSVDCDLQSFDSVRRAAAEVAQIADARGGLDGLLNNAGVMGLPDERTQDGYDVQMQTNHLSHFLLTALLMPSLEQAAASRGEARIVQHSSGARGAPPRGGDGRLERRYFSVCARGTLGGDGLGKCFKRYHQTKLANSVFSMCLHERLREVGSAVKSICAEPGVAATALVDNLKRGHQAAKKAVASSSTASPGDVLTASSAFKGIQSAADGACSLIEAAFARFVDCGDFLMPGDIVRKTVVGTPVKCMTAGRPTPTSEYMRVRFEREKLTMDTGNRTLLWEASAKAVGTEPRPQPSSASSGQSSRL